MKFEVFDHDGDCDGDDRCSHCDGDFMMFTCPNCYSPTAQTTEPHVDIHSGATYTCSDCGEPVIFVALTVKEYTKR